MHKEYEEIDNISSLNDWIFSYIRKAKVVSVLDTGKGV
jgi:hypothetical protein